MDSTRELINDAEERIKDQTGRIGAYRKFADAYFSDTPDASGESVRGSYGDGRPALIMQQTLEDLDSRDGAPKLIKAMVDDIVSIRGVVPNIAVIAEDTTPEHEKLATKRTRGLRQWWKNSRMVLKQPRAAWSMATKGDVLYILNPRFPEDAERDNDPFRPAGIYIDVVPVDSAFPRFRVGEDSDQLDDLFIISSISRHAAKEMYAYAGNEDKVRVIVYYDDKCKRVIVGEREFGEPIEHDLGFVPAEWHQNKPTDARLAQADINDCIELERTMQRQWHVFGDALLWATYPVAVLLGKFAGDSQTYGPGAHLEGDVGASFQLVAPAANVSAAQLIYHESKDAIMQQAGVSPVRMQGEINKSNVTGRAVAAQMSPQEARLSSANERLSGSLVMLNAKGMLMFARLPGFKGAELTLDAVPKELQGKDTVTPDDFGGWIANEVVWDSALHLNMHERMAMGLQLHKEGLFSSKRVLEYIGEDDPERTLKEAKADMQERMAQMAQMQGGGPPGAAPPSGPPGQGQPGGDPTTAAHQAMSLAAGGQGAPPGGGEPGAPVQPAPQGQNGQAPPGLSGFEPLAAPPGSPMGTPAPLDNPIPKVDEALAAVQLRGQIVQRAPIEGGFRVFLTDHRDIAPVKAALRAVLGPGVQLDVRVAPKAPAAASNGNGRSA